MLDITKGKAVSLLQQGISPLQIADELDISYSAVLKLKKEFELALENGAVDTLVSMEKVIVQEASEMLGLEGDEALTVIAGLTGLERLSCDLQNTALHINTRVRSLIMSTEHCSELETYAKIICSLQDSFMNKASTTVNVQNNFGQENKGTKHYAQYLSDAPVA